MAQSVQIHSIRSHYTEGTPCCQSRCGRAPSLHERRWFKQISILLFPELGATPRRFKTLKVFVWAISLHHFERDGVPASCSSSDAFLRSLSLSLSLSLQLDTWTNPRVNSEAHGHWEKGILTESSFPWSIFFYLFPGLSWQGKVLARNIGGTSDSEIITKLFSPANDIKGWARVVVFNHFWVTHIFKNLMKALYSLPGENQVCAHTQHSVCECRQFSWSIVHLRVSQGSMNPSLMMNPKKYLHGPLADKALLHLSLLRQFREAGTHSTHTERYCRHGF